MKDVIALSELVEKIDFQQKLALEARHMLERDYTDRELYERFEAAAKEQSYMNGLKLPQRNLFLHKGG